MPDTRTIRAASDLVWSHWQAGTSMQSLPSEIRPTTRRDGYAIQSLLALRTSRPLVGWKIAATSVMGQRHIGVSGPIAGRLLAERTHVSGAMLSLAGNRMCVAEPEFAFRAGRALGPRSTPWTVDEVMEAMDALLPAIEVPNSRFEDFASVGEAQLVADNACAHDVVLGPPTAADWRALDLSKHRVTGTIAGRTVREGSGANVLGDPRLALTWLVNELSGLGLVLAAGEVVITGVTMQPLDVVPGDRVTADFGALGRIEVAFVE
jgi:2-keto-4-pentenoate hydratase